MTPTEMDKEIKHIVLERSFAANTGHIGSCLSVSAIIAALYAPDGGVLNIGDPDDPERDRFVLSKGHAALALYAALHLRGWISKGELDTFCQPGSPIYTHPNHEVRGVDFSTGSLGMGLSFGAGAALAAKMQGSQRKVYVLLSDAELNEGSTWETVMFAAHHKLNNLIAIVDANGQQAMGKTADVSCVSVINMFRAAGWWPTNNLPMQDANTTAHYLNRATYDASLEFPAERPTRLPIEWRTSATHPACVVVPTTFGHGVSFMENALKWHYAPMNADEYAQAMAEVE